MYWRSVATGPCAAARRAPQKGRIDVKATMRIQRPTGFGVIRCSLCDRYVDQAIIRTSPKVGRETRLCLDCASEAVNLLERDAVDESQELLESAARAPSWKPEGT